MEINIYDEARGPRATEKQKDYIETLLESLDLTWDEARAEFDASEWPSDMEDLELSDATDAIDRLKEAQQEKRDMEKRHGSHWRRR
jgi:hypothetical protein